MSTIEMRAAVLPEGMTAETYDPWHCVTVEWRGKKNWVVTDTEKRRLHVKTNEWTEARLPELYTFTTRGSALLAARRYMYAAHVGGKMWSDGEATTEQLIHDIRKQLNALSVAGNSPRPHEVADGMRKEVEEYLANLTGEGMYPYPEEFHGAVLTNATVEQHWKNIYHDTTALRALGYPTTELQEHLVRASIEYETEGFKYTTQVRHMNTLLPREYLEQSQASDIAGLITRETQKLLLECYEEGVAAEYLALLPEVTEDSVRALREMYDNDVSDEYIRAAFAQ